MAENIKFDYCQWCGGSLIPKLGQYGYFMSCINFPRCKFGRGFTEEDKRIYYTPEETETKNNG